CSRGTIGRRVTASAFVGAVGMRVGGVRRVEAVPSCVIGARENYTTEIGKKGADAKKGQQNCGGDEAPCPSVLGWVGNHVEAFAQRRVLNLRYRVQLAEHLRSPRMHLFLDVRAST